MPHVARRSLRALPPIIVFALLVPPAPHAEAGGAAADEDENPYRNFVVTRVVKRQGGMDGPVTSVTTNTYDRGGNLLTQVIDQGFQLETASSTYNRQGLLLTRLYTSIGAFASIRERTANAYDDKGRLLRSQWEHVATFPGGSDLVLLNDTTHAYDRHGFLRTSVVRKDEWGEQSIHTITYSYDRLGQLVRSVDERDGAGPPYVVTTSYDYDRRGRLRRTVVEVDYFFFGSADDIQTTTYTYDGRAQLLASRTVSDFGADGVADRARNVTNTYDHRGHVLSATIEEDEFADGTVESGETTTNTYDGRGNLLVQQRAESDAGVVVSGLTTTHAYTRRGHLSAVVQEYDLDGDGTADATWTTTYVYGRLSQLAERP